MSPNNSISKYNPHTNEWETVGQDWALKYNPHTNTWSYVPSSN